MNLGQVGPEIAENFGAHRSSSTLSREAADGAPHGAAKAKGGLFDDLVDALAAEQRRAADDDPAKQTMDGCILPFQLPLMPPDAAVPEANGDAAAQIAASNQGPASAIEPAIANVIESTAKAVSSAAQTTATAALRLPAQAIAPAAPEMPATSHDQQTTAVDPQQKKPQPEAEAATAGGTDAAAPALQKSELAYSDGTAVSAAPSRGEPRRAAGWDGRTDAPAAHAPRIAARAEQQPSSMPAIRVSRAQVRLMNAQTPAASADSAQISARPADAMTVEIAPQAEASVAATPGVVSAVKTISAAITAQQTVAAAAAQVPTLDAATISDRAADADAAAPERSPSEPVSGAATAPAIDTSQESVPAETKPDVQAPVAPSPTIEDPTTAKAPHAPSSRTAHAEEKHGAVSAQWARQASREAFDQPLAKETVQRGVESTVSHASEVEDVAAQSAAAEPPVAESSREEPPARAAADALASKPVREGMPPRIDVQARPENAERLLERAIASQEPADTSTERDIIAPERSSPSGEASASVPAQRGSDQEAFSGQHSREHDGRQEWTMGVPVERASTPARRAPDAREAAEAALPSVSGSAPRTGTVVHTAVPALLQPQHLEATVATTTAADAAATLAPDTADRLVQSMRLQYQRGGGDAVLQIRPEHLGPITISLRVENGVVSAVVSAEHPATAEWLQSNQQSLKESLQQSGLHLERFVVQRDGQSPSDRQRREWSDARRRDVRRRVPQQDSTFEITI